jgi:hypothetical protein
MPGVGPALDQELSRLPAKYRAPLVLCYLRGQTHDQAATALQCPVGTVRSRMARGRDLLRRRLTRRGCAPSAALFGAGLDVPAHLLTEVVPAQLVAATVEGAFAIGSSHTIQAGAAAASVLALTQGVVTTMKIAQLKWIGLALLATGLSAGGAAVVAAVSAQNPVTTGGVSVSAVASAGPFQEGATGTVSTTTSTEVSSKSTEARLRALEDQSRLRTIEDQIDQMVRLTRAAVPGFPPNTPALERMESKLQSLLSLHARPGPFRAGFASSSTTTGSQSPSSATSASRGARSASGSAKTSTSTGTSSGAATSGTGTTATSTTAARDATASFTTTRYGEPRASSDGSGSSTRIRELEAQIEMAAVPLRNTRKLVRQNVVSQGELDLLLSQFNLPLARLRGLDEDFASELEACKLVVKKKQAELDEAMAQKEVAMALVARNHRLNERTPGMVAAEDVAQAEAQLRSGAAHVRVKAVEVEEAELQCRKLERWRERTQQIIESSTKLQ